MQNISVSNNKKYLMQGDKPFFWFGDTAWNLLQKLEEEDIRIYFRNRAELGFNVIQTVLVNTLPGVNNQGSLAPGYKDVTQPEYWNFVDHILDLAEEYNLYLGLLPCWGEIVKMGIVNMDNVQTYMDFLGKRYQNRSNLIWILGGDIRGDLAIDVYKKAGAILKSYNPERLITFHPFGRTDSSLWFHEESWLDMNMFQSGHRRYDQARLGEWDDNTVKEEFFGEDNWKYVRKDHTLPSMKPVVDGEPSYEGIPQGLHNPHNPYWEEWDVRRYAYWSLFEGAAGHTYGSNAIMQFYTDADGKGAFGVRESWKDALHHAGAGQIQFLKNLMESVDYVNGYPDDTVLLYGQKERYHRVSVFRGESYLLCYTYTGNQFLLDLKDYMDKKMDVYWMNPENGAMSYDSTITGIRKWLASPVKRKGIATDWVLVMKEAK